MASSKELESLQSGRDGRFILEYVGDIAILKMDRHENRLNLNFFNGFNKALDEVESKKNIRVLVTTNVGKFFCNGIDLAWLVPAIGREPETANLYSTKMNELLVRILTFPMLTVAAINGHAFAGGGLLSIVHDYRIMNAERGWWCMNEVHINLLFSPWIIHLFRYLFSSQARTEALILGMKFTGEEARALGIVHLTSAEDSFLKTVQHLAARVLPPNEAINRTSLHNMKCQINGSALKTLADQKKVQLSLFNPTTSSVQITGSKL